MNNIFFYKDSGKGKPVILIHGFCENQEIWAYQVKALEKTNRVISIDIPGFGQSHWDITGLDIDELSEIIAHELKKILGTEKAIFIGHSMGGYISLAIAEKFPEMLCGLGLVHSTAYADTDEKKRNRVKSAEYVSRHGKEPFLETFVPSLFHDKKKEYLDETMKIVMKTPGPSILQLTLAMRDRPDRSALLPKLDYPVWFLAGKKDTLMPYEQLIEQSNLPKDCMLHLMENIGHMAMIEAREKTAIALEGFVKYCQA